MTNSSILFTREEGLLKRLTLGGNWSYGWFNGFNIPRFLRKNWNQGFLIGGTIQEGILLRRKEGVSKAVGHGWPLRTPLLPGS